MENYLKFKNKIKLKTKKKIKDSSQRTILKKKSFHALAKFFSSVKALSELYISLNVVFTLGRSSMELTEKEQIFICFSKRHILDPE